MADGTNIEWTDATWNPITGCQVKSPGCKFCYAMKLAGTRLKHHPSREGLTVDTKNGPVWTGEVRFNEQWLTQPLHWTKPRMIFVCAHADLFYEAVPDVWIDRVFAVMSMAPQHAFQVLTKRPGRMRDYLARVEQEPFRNTVKRFADAMPPSPWPSFDGMAFPSPNIWLGVSVEDQAHADERRESMRRLSEMGWKTWVSYEPALGPVDWTGWEFLDWIVSGGESDANGKSARPHHPDWHRATRDFGAANGIPYLFKQWGCLIDADQVASRIAAVTEAGAAWIVRDGKTWVPPVPLNFDDAAWLAKFLGHSFEHQSDGTTLLRMKKGDAGRLLDGRTHDEFPAVRP
ncbi:phage Gp37/Gp68 family protein [Mesorhizobium sp. M0074]|uniref:phage Gp37/Gp68 family protein n=1 Tax=unclassified Mesorhizobium TaxID=325217 RepID=UPI0033358931